MESYLIISIKCALISLLLIIAVISITIFMSRYASWKWNNANKVSYILNKNLLVTLNYRCKHLLYFLIFNAVINLWIYFINCDVKYEYVACLHFPYIPVLCFVTFINVVLFSKWINLDAKIKKEFSLFLFRKETCDKLDM